jgi:hypothetical protein
MGNWETHRDTGRQRSGPEADAAAESLSEHVGDLALNGLLAISDAAAESLSKHKGTVALCGLKSLSEGAKRSFDSHAGVYLPRG